MDEISVFLKLRGREAAKTRKKAIFTLLLSRFGLKTRIIFLSYVGRDMNLRILELRWINKKESHVTLEWNTHRGQYASTTTPDLRLTGQPTRVGL